MSSPRWRACWCCPPPAAARRPPHRRLRLDNSPPALPPLVRRVCLAASCRTLRAASVDWFSADVFEVKAWSATRARRLAEQSAWRACSRAGRDCAALAPAASLRASNTASFSFVAARVCLTIDLVQARYDRGEEPGVLVLSSLAAGGARVVSLSVEGQLDEAPAELAGLTQLTRLVFDGQHHRLGRASESSWENLPQTLQQLELDARGLCWLPPALSRLTQLRELSLHPNSIGHRSGWQSLPRQLMALDLRGGSLRRVPAAFSALEQLSKLSLRYNNLIDGGLESLPQQLQELDLGDCGLRQVPELAALTQLSQLSLQDSNLDAGWHRLPPQLLELDLSSCCQCYPQPIPAVLAGIMRLSKLTLASSGAVQGGWRRLPPQLVELDLSSCNVRWVPAELAGKLKQLSKLSLARNPIQGGLEILPRQLQQLDLGDCGLRQVPAALAAMTQLGNLSLRGNDLQGESWQGLPRQLRELDLGRSQLRQIPAELAALTQLSKLSLCGNPHIEGATWGRLPPQLQLLDVSNCGLRQVLSELAGRQLSVVGLQWYGSS